MSAPVFIVIVIVLIDAACSFPAAAAAGARVRVERVLLVDHCTPGPCQRHRRRDPPRLRVCTVSEWLLKTAYAAYSALGGVGKGPLGDGARAGGGGSSAGRHEHAGTGWPLDKSRRRCRWNGWLSSAPGQVPSSSSPSSSTTAAAALLGGVVRRLFRPGAAANLHPLPSQLGTASSTRVLQRARGGDRLRRQHSPTASAGARSSAHLALLRVDARFWLVAAHCRRLICLLLLLFGS